VLGVEEALLLGGGEDKEDEVSWRMKDDDDTLSNDATRTIVINDIFLHGATRDCPDINIIKPGFSCVSHPCRYQSRSFADSLSFGLALPLYRETFVPYGVRRYGVHKSSNPLVIRK
jgi:hypothetical protein